MISLVTACMNRDAHLRRTLPAWLALPDIAEVVVVDWSNCTSLRDLTALDPRVRVIRAEGEARWILSYAYNLGISHARHETILKCDSDCVPTAAVTALHPTENAFYAGYWKTGAACGKPSVNGQCLFTKAQFERVNGYSEVIRMYGRDDEDFYDRMITAGFARREIPPAELSFIEHTQQERLANQTGAQPADPVERFLQRQPTYFEMYNLALTKLLPWGIWQARARYATAEESGNWLACRRDTAREIPVAPPLQAMARLHGLRLVTAAACGLPAQQVMGMDEATCLVALRRRLNVPVRDQRERIPA
jgi:hypothetical protein